MWNFVVHTHFSVLQKDPETTSTSLSTRFFCCNFPLLFEASHTIQLTSCASARSTKNLPSRWLWTIVPLAAFLVGEKISRKSYPPGNQDGPSWKVVWEDGWEMSSFPEGKSNKATVQWIFCP